MDMFGFYKKFLFLFRTILVLSALFLFVRMTNESTSSYHSGKNLLFSPPPPTKPLVGLYACNLGLDDSFPNTSPYLTTNYMWSSPIIDGVVERFSWAHLEPTNGTYSFNRLDTECQRAIANGKLITLDIYGGVDAPKWLVRSPYVLGTDFKVFYANDNGTMGCDTFPLVWSKNYIANFDTFIRKVSQHLSLHTYVHAGHTYKYKDAIGMVKVGTCCTIYTSELRVPDDFCTSGLGCCTSTDSEKWVGQSKYNVATLEASIDHMTFAAADTFKGKIMAIPIVSGGKGFPSPQMPMPCTPTTGYIDCITPHIYQDLISHIGDTNQVMGIYESLNTGTNDGSVCKELTDATHGIIPNYHCILGYQLDATVFGGHISDSVDCGDLMTALNMIGLSAEKARYFEVFEHEFKTLGCEQTTSDFYTLDLY